MKKGGEDRFYIPDESFVSDDTFVLQEKFYHDTIELQSSFKFLRAGARKYIYYKPEEVKAAIVTCGGVCPGLNVVIRSIVMSLERTYGINEVWGVKWGYRGFYEDFP